MITIVLTDDHKVMRQGLSALLREQPDFQVVGEASNAKEALRLIESLRPNVLVSDMVMVGMNGLELTSQVKRVAPETIVVILSMYGTAGYVHKAMRSGAKAYVLKDASADELVTAIRQAVSGQRYLSRTLSEQAIDSYIKEITPVPHQVGASLILTAREHEVLQMIARGDKNKEIAVDLGISPRTVEFHRSNIMRKLGVQTQQDLFLYCANAGILQEKT
ncbi:MAG: response regulator transcription factor [Dehalococcoidales bacterium]|nr:response regulator transcription factor [Dehalococcoidales bacterium]